MGDELEIQENNGLNTDDIALFEDFLHDLDVIYARTDEVLRACGAATKLRLRPMQESGEPADMLVHYVLRRYFKAERMVVVWRDLSQGEV
ncbi:hypothetical protein PR003_g7413 [Phytophthora rubi]|uniref:Uncharacterized protein n=1 Tax=Phytophthora rubi TaxID=129364 RepID=A0A6A4FJX8_9STRA|nr:hypothetical protein PR002_g5071 [Phytophthora rubi]KAE9346469.1 hypothetical protein PR003_g7413 [Phytophthora rubi]